MVKKQLILILVFMFTNLSFGFASKGEKIIKKNRCGSCHKLKGPAAKTIKDILKRIGPDLFYAGSKYQENYLVSFLQKPINIRPAGPVYVNNIKFDGQKDVIKEKILCKSKLPKDKAVLAAKYLMTLKDSKMKKGIYKQKRFSIMKAKVLFEKNEACHACHQIKFRGRILGGNSGSILYNAGKRLNGDWVYSYIQNPQYWDPKIWMPRKKLPQSTIQLFTNYLMTMKD